MQRRKRTSALRSSFMHDRENYMMVVDYSVDADFFEDDDEHIHFGKNVV